MQNKSFINLQTASSELDMDNDQLQIISSKANRLFIASEEARSIATAMRELASKNNILTVLARTPDVGDTDFYADVKEGYTTNADLRRDIDHIGKDSDDIKRSCLDLSVTVVKWAAAPPKPGAKPDPEQGHWIKIGYMLFKTYPVFRFDTNAKGVKQKSLRWAFFASGNLEILTPAENESKDKPYSLQIIDKINRPYYTFEKMCKNVDSKFAFSADLRASLDGGDASVYTLGFEYISKPYTKKDILDYMTSLYSRMGNVMTYRDPKNGRKIPVSVSRAKRIKISEVLAHNHKSKRVTLRKKSKAAEVGKHTCTLEIMQHRQKAATLPEVEGVTPAPSKEPDTHHIKFRYTISKAYLLSNKAALFSHLKDDAEARMFENGAYTITARDFSRIAVETTVDGVTLTGEQAFQETIKGVLRRINEEEFILPQIMSLTDPAAVAAKIDAFLEPQKRDRVQKRREFIDAYMMGKTHHSRGSALKGTVKTDTLIADMLNMDRKTLRGYRKELLDVGLDMDIPYSLLLKVSELAMTNEFTLQESRDYAAGAGSKSADRRNAKAPDQIDYFATDTTFLGLSMSGIGGKLAVATKHD